MADIENSNAPNNRTRRVLRGVTSANHIPKRYSLLSSKMLSKSTQAGILDNKTGKWAVRIDKAHSKGANYPHMNVNSKLTGVPDPHTPLPGAIVNASGPLVKTLQFAGKVALVASVAVDTYQISATAVRDLSENGALGGRTAKVTGSTAGAWIGGAGGAMGGNTVGAWIGGAIGAAFGGVGAVPGAVIGSVIGSIAGGIWGANEVSTAVERIIDNIRGVSIEEEEDDLNEENDDE